MASIQETVDNYDGIPLPALLHVTRGVYTDAAHQAQARVGCGDVPASGEFILSAMEWSGVSIDSIVRWLGVTKQTVSEAVDVLVARGYLERTEDPLDRRRVKLSLTDRGHVAGRAARAAIERVDSELRARVGTESIAHTRKTLIALLEIKRRSQGVGAQETPIRTHPARLRPAVGAEQRKERSSRKSAVKEAA